MEAAKVYENETCANSLNFDVAQSCKFAYLFSTPTIFLMGRPVEKGAEYNLITDISHEFSNPDCWWIHLAAGDLSEFLKYEPFLLPWFGWERNNKPRYWRRKEIIRWLKHS